MGIRVKALLWLSLLCAACAGAQTYQPNWESIVLSIR